MPKLTVVLRWARINTAFMMAAFLIIGALVALFPHAMLSFFGSWASFLEGFGARSASGFSSPTEMFSHILQRNTIAAFVYFAVGMLLQAPLALILGGAFYGLVAFLAPMTIGRSFGPADWFLVAAESAALVLSASLASAFSSDLYGVTPSLSGWWRYFRNSWRSLSMKPIRPAAVLLASWAVSLALGILIIAGLVLFVAWFETYGY